MPTLLFILLLSLMQMQRVAPYVPVQVWCAPDPRDNDPMRFPRRTAALGAVVQGDFSSPSTLFGNGHGRWVEAFNVQSTGAVHVTYAAGLGKEEVSLEVVIPYIHELQLAACLAQAHQVLDARCASNVPAGYVVMHGESADSHVDDHDVCLVDPMTTTCVLGFGTSTRFMEELFNCPYPGCIYRYQHRTLHVRS